MPVTEPFPTDLPEWDPTNPARIEDPGAPKKAAGWDDGEAPPAKWFNWQWNLVYQWLRYIADVLSNSYAVEHNATNGTHSDVTADTVDISDTLFVGNANQLEVDDAGNLTTSGSVGTADYVFTGGFLKNERILILQTDALVKAADTPGSVIAGTTGPSPILQLLTGQSGVIPFNMGNEHSLDEFTLWLYANIGTAYDLTWQLVRMSEATMDWVAVHASLDGTITGTAGGTGFANLFTESVSVPDLNAIVAGHGFYTGAGADGDMYGIKLTNNHGSNSANILMLRTEIWRYGLGPTNGI